MIKLSFISFSFVWSIFSFSQIRIAHPVYEFGDIFEENGFVYAQFELENPYLKDTIFISSILTTCGCTIVETKDSIIFPRNKMMLKVAYDPNGRVGRFHKSIQINTITGVDEVNKLFLKVGGNVIPKNKVLDKNAQLINFEVAPMYFYPVTEYDTSFLDFNFIKDFVNTLTYEIDFYQFTKIGFEINLRDSSKINEFDYLLRFVKYKLIRELNKRGYPNSSLFFNEPVYYTANAIPKWASAELKVFSIAFNNNRLNESNVKMTDPLKEDELFFILNENSSSPVNLNSLIQKIDFNFLSNILLKDSILSLQVDYKVPESFSAKKQQKIIKAFKKELFKELEALVGIDDAELKIVFDNEYSHSSSQHKFKMWELEEVGSQNIISYQPEEESIISPLLPSYKHQFLDLNEKIDENSLQFQQFWNTLISYTKSSNNVKLVIESSTSHFPKGDNADDIYTARQRGTEVKVSLEKKYYEETGDSIVIEIINVVLGPKWSEKMKYVKFSQSDYFQYEYIKLLPVFTKDRKLNLSPVPTRPYMVNYDYYFKAIDTNSFVFKRFASYLIYEIQKNGYIRITTESSNSKIPFEKDKSNEYIAYEHLLESKKVLNDYLKKHLIDPNRLILDKENIIVQGIPYSKKTPIVRYKKYQYVRFIPSRYLTN